MLLHWAEFYKSLNGLPATDRPDDETLADDEALDRWYRSFTADLDRKQGRRQRVPIDGSVIPSFRPD